MFRGERNKREACVLLWRMGADGLYSFCWFFGFSAVEEPSESLLAFADDNDLTIHHLGLQEGNNPWDPLTVDCVMDAVQVSFIHIKRKIR